MHLSPLHFIFFLSRLYMLHDLKGNKMGLYVVSKLKTVPDSFEIDLHVRFVHKEVNAHNCFLCLPDSVYSYSKFLTPCAGF